MTLSQHIPPEEVSASEEHTFPVYRGSHPNDANGPYIYVSPFTSQHVGGGWRMGSQAKLICVYAIGRHGELYRQVVRGHSRTDPDRRNNLGQYGAIVTDPPTEEEIQNAAKQAHIYLAAEANLLDPLPLRDGWGTLYGPGWSYQPFEPPTEEGPGKEGSAYTSWDPDPEKRWSLCRYRVEGRAQHWAAYDDEWAGELGTYATPERALDACENDARRR